jgi:uncharacterized protein YbaR (Trm112 family)
MVDKELVAIFVCPADHRPLSMAGEGTIARVNRAIGVRRVKNRGGHVVEQAVDGGLLSADNSLLYPILDGIPLLAPDEAIRLEEIV